MTYAVKSEILGFENLKEVKLSEIDELFATLESTQTDGVSFTLVNPYALREYSFDVPNAIQSLLQIGEQSKVLVYNIAVLQKPVEESTVNFKAPLIFNTENGTMAQVVLGSERHPDYGLAESIKSFK